MKRNLFFMIAVFFLFSCEKKEVKLNDIDFDITLDKQTFKVGDSVKFNFVGSNPDIITFYSGEGKNDYTFLEKDKFLESRYYMQFSSSRFAASTEIDNRHLNPVKFMYSTDFNGNYNETDINAANWTDITDLFYIPPSITSAAELASSKMADVSKAFNESNGTVYFGFFYKTEYGKSRTNFRFQSFLLESSIPKITVIPNKLYDLVSAEFKLVLGDSFNGVASANAPFINLSNGAPTFITFRAPEGITQPERKAYAITKAMLRPEATNVGPAVGLGIKSFISPSLESYTHVYANPGTYLVTFIAQNTNIYDSKKQVKQIEIVVEQ